MYRFSRRSPASSRLIDTRLLFAISAHAGRQAECNNFQFCCLHISPVVRVPICKERTTFLNCWFHSDRTPPNRFIARHGNCVSASAWEDNHANRDSMVRTRNDALRADGRAGTGEPAPGRRVPDSEGPWSPNHSDGPWSPNHDAGDVPEGDESPIFSGTDESLFGRTEDDVDRERRVRDPEGTWFQDHGPGGVAERADR